MRELKPSQFPALLKEIPQKDIPEKLYLEGELPDNDMKFLAVVGARKYTPYGKEACEKIIAGLRGYPIVIVSGLALGIDGIAHRAALDAGLRTIAVPGSGLHPQHIYPASHRQLAKQILESGGALLSEFEPKHPTYPWNFPQRNRIMAGMCHATLLIEAEKKSGTMITARLAAEYNRDVLVVPNSIFSKTSEGPHLLMRIGAAPITSSSDLLQELGFEPSTKPSQQNLFADCSSAEIELLKLLETSPLPRDEMIRQSKKSASEVNALLSLMEIKGIIKESNGEIRQN